MNFVTVKYNLAEALLRYDPFTHGAVADHPESMSWWFSKPARYGRYGDAEYESIKESQDWSAL